MSELMCSQSKCRRKDEHIAELKAELAALRDAYEAAAIKHLGVSEDGEWVSVPRWFLDTMATVLQEKGE